MAHLLEKLSGLLLATSTLVAVGLPSGVAQTSDRESTESTTLEIDSVVLRPLREVEAPFQKAGLLMEIAVAEGEYVAAGQRLAVLDDRLARRKLAEAETARDQIEAELASDLRIQYAEKALEVARAELARSKESIAEFAGSVSQSQLDVERLTVDKLLLERRQAMHERSIREFELRMKEHAVAAARLDIELHELRAPTGGIVVLLRAEEGEWVEAGQPLVRLIVVERLRAEGFADAEAILPYKEGDPAELLVEGSVLPVSGKLRLISPEVDPVTRQVRVWAEVDNTEATLRPGLGGKLSLKPAVTSNQ